MYVCIDAAGVQPHTGLPEPRTQQDKIFIDKIGFWK